MSPAGKVPALQRCRVQHKRRLAKEVYLLTLQSPEIAHRAEPGNFVNIRVSDSFVPLWRRPFSIDDARPNADEFDILFHVVGSGTRLLSRVQVDDELDVLGPLGNSFPIPDPPAPVLLVAGGLGIAPFLLAARRLRDAGSRVVLLYGARDREHLIDTFPFREIGVEVHLATDDGSEGWKGTVAEMYRELSPELPRDALVYTCGPTASVAALARVIESEPAPRRAWASLETLMACGIGACVGCVVETKAGDGYLLVCKDGPVFQLDEVKLW